MSVITIQRVASAANPAPTGTSQVGAATVDLTPHAGLPMAGYSTKGETAQGVVGRLFAHAVHVEGADGRGVAIVVADLMSATRYVQERAAEATAAIGITIDRLVLLGTHTHTGPGWMYGDTLYDTFAQKEPGFDRALADWLAARIALAVSRARERRVPALAGFDRRDVWGLSRNRSLEAFRAGPLAAGWNASGPGASAPPALRPDQRAVDPRLTTLAFYAASDGSALASLSFFGAHFTSIGEEVALYSSDLAGHAVREARFAADPQRGRFVAALAPAGAGDANVLRKGLDHERETGPALAQWVGERLGREMAAAVVAARAGAAPFALSARFAEPRPTDLPPGVPGVAPLAPRWTFGAPVLAGSEESRTLLYPVLAQEPMTSGQFAPGHPHHPKAEALGPLQPLLQELLDLDPCPVFPLRQVRIGDHLLATVPGEPTSQAARAIEERLLAADPTLSSATVVGYGGAYLGYFTTPGEHSVQCYEGASTIYGSTTLPYLAAWHERLAATPPAAPPVGPVDFRPGPSRHRFGASSVAPAHAPRPTLRRAGDRIDLAWEMGPGTRLLLADSWLVRLEEGVAGGWRVVRHLGADLDDRDHALLVRRRPWLEVNGSGIETLLFPERWEATLFVPAATAASGHPLRVVVSRWDAFPGFAVPVPP